MISSFWACSSGARGPPQFLKKTSENVWANEIFDLGSHQFRESLQELLREFCFSHCTSCETPFREWDFAFREFFLNSESCSENTPEPSQSSENGLFTPRAFFSRNWGGPQASELHYITFLFRINGPDLRGNFLHCRVGFELSSHLCNFMRCCRAHHVDIGLHYMVVFELIYRLCHVFCITELVPRAQHINFGRSHPPRKIIPKCPIGIPTMNFPEFPGSAFLLAFPFYLIGNPEFPGIFRHFPGPQIAFSGGDGVDMLGSSEELVLNLSCNILGCNNGTLSDRVLKVGGLGLEVRSLSNLCADGHVLLFCALVRVLSYTDPIK